jgi:dihydroxy-acid dehydratase
MLDRIDSPDLDVTPDHVLILRNVGPRGVPGMPEWGAIPIPEKLLRQGVRDIVRITDCRMSGTSYGTVILHVTPEAVADGLLALVQDGDSIAVDIYSRQLNLLLSDDEIARRRSRWSRPASKHLRGFLRLYEEHVLQADEGCDFDFLKPQSPESLRFVPPVVGRS